MTDQRADWLARRRQFSVTASDAAAVLGADPRRGPLRVYAEKVGALVSEEDEDWLAFGRDVEGAIAKGYTRKTGRPARDLGATTIQVHPDLTWLGATLDRETEGSEQLPAPAPGAAPLEAKAVGGKAVAGWKDTEPVFYVIQVQIQMACTGAQWGSLAPMFHGQVIEARDLLRNDRFLAAALPRLEEFHLRVQRREPPEEVDALPSTSEALRALFPGDGTTVALDQAATDLADQWAVEKMKAGQHGRAADELQNTLRRRLEGATFGALLDGTFLKLDTTIRRGYTVAPTTYTTLRRWRPRLRRRA